MRLIFDIETAPDTSALPLLGAPKAPSNYKDPEKIAAYISDQLKTREADMALEPSLCRIVALGTDLGVSVCPDPEVERECLVQFWDAYLDAGVRVGYNVIGFDLPVLVARSRILRVRVPDLGLTKYRADGVRDLMLDLSPTGTYKSMNFWCKRLSLDVPKDESTGADIGALVQAGDWNAIAAHCEADIKKTAALYDYLHTWETDEDVF